MKPLTKQIQALITEEYKKGYTSGVIDNSINKDKLVLEARINVANKITVGGRGGTEIFIENVPLQTYLTQLKKGLSNE